VNAKHLIWGLTAASLLSPPSMSVVRTADAQHDGHRDLTRGPLPDAVREATERFRDVNDAIAAGYVQSGGCVSGPQEGAMGVHFVNMAFFDDKLEVEHPEALVYEPRNGRLYLAAAEYITPAAAWESSHEDFELPELMGHLFHFVPGPNRYGPPAFYELHVWAWKDNPNGAFADWNPKASCAAWGGPPS
jgi:hypothetical protein